MSIRHQPHDFFVSREPRELLLLLQNQATTAVGELEPDYYLWTYLRYWMTVRKENPLWFLQ